MPRTKHACWDPKMLSCAQHGDVTRHIERTPPGHPHEPKEWIDFNFGQQTSRAFRWTAFCTEPDHTGFPCNCPATYYNIREEDLNSLKIFLRASKSRLEQLETEKRELESRNEQLETEITKLREIHERREFAMDKAISVLQRESGPDRGIFPGPQNN